MNGSMVDLLVAREILAEAERSSRRAHLYGDLPRRSEGSLAGRIWRRLRGLRRRPAPVLLASRLSTLPSATVTTGR